MNYQQEYAALILLQATQGVIHKRRKLETMCGYPSDYGGDELLIKRLDEFLSDTNIQHEVKDAIEFARKFPEA